MIALPTETEIVGLTRRQLLAIDGLSTGKPAKVVAADLSMSVHTLNRDISHAIHALNTGNAAGLVGVAFRKGWIE
jgi:DNA-binding NarL/FixJ family response regulator